MRGADGEPLLLRLRKSPTPELQRLVEDHAAKLGIREVRQLLLNPFADGEIARAVASIRGLGGEYEVKSALARFHRTPEPIALGIIPNLRWRDLLEVSLTPRVRPVVRRTAERYIEARLSRLSVGERITLARRAAGGLLSSLLQEGDILVVRAALDNPRLTRERVVRACVGHSTSTRLLDAIAGSRWATSYEVKVALCRNPLTPFQRVLALLPKLHCSDLEAITQIEAHSSFVRVRAQEQLDANSRPS